MDLVFGAERIDRRVSDVEKLLVEWHEKERDWGDLYLDYRPVTTPDRLQVEDLAVTMLINSRVVGQAAASFARHAGSVDLSTLPDKALEETTVAERQSVAGLIATLTSWPWIGASVATKTLHKKRPRLIPVLDNMAIFGAYMYPDWPEQRALADSVKAEARIAEALDWITHDLTRSENRATWAALLTHEPRRSRIELFDMVWWMHFQAHRIPAPSTSAPTPSDKAEL